MNNGATSEKAYRSLKRFRLYTRITMLLPILVGVGFHYVAIATALGVPEVIKHFGHPEGVPIAFGILGLVFLVPGVVTFVAIGKYPGKDKLIDVLDDDDPAIRDQYKSVRTIGIVLMVVSVVLACICVVAIVDLGNFTHAFVRPDLVPFGFGFLALLVFILGITLFVSRWRTKKELIQEQDERNQAITEKASAIAFTSSLALFVLVTLGLTTLGYMNEVSMFAFLGVAILSWVVFVAARIYYRKRL